MSSDLSGINFTVVGGEKDDNLRSELCDLYTNNYFVDEPVLQSFGVLDESFGEILRGMVYDRVMPSVDGQRCTVVARDDADGKVVGSFIGHHLQQPVSRTVRPYEFDDETKQKYPTQVQRMELLYYLRNGTLQYNPAPLMEDLQCKRLFFGDLLCTSRDFRSRGLGRELTRRSLEVAREAGCDCYTTWASVNGSRKIFQGFGFEDLRGLKYDEFVYDKTGELVVKDSMGHVGSYVMFKRLH